MALFMQKDALLILEKRPIVEKGIKKLSLMESKKIIAISSSEQRNDYRAYH
jgi:hypothetical protein